MSKIVYTGSGISLSTALFITFLVLKLCNVITWSWWWVTAPLWIPFGIALLFLFGIGIWFFIVAFFLSKHY